MLVLGIDPGSRLTGYALLLQNGRQMQVRVSGAISLIKAKTLTDRLALLFDQLSELVKTERPDVVAVEDVFAAKNARSALALGQARGAVLAAIGRFAIPVATYSPAMIKKAATGHGRADKAQVQQMMRIVLKLESLPGKDEADAMAVAVCHAMNARNTRVLGATASHTGGQVRRRNSTNDFQAKLNNRSTLERRPKAAQ